MPSRITGLIGIVLFGWPLWGAASYTAPTLMTDWQVASSVQSLPGLRAEAAKCTSFRFIVNICAATLIVGDSGSEFRREVNYAYSGLPLGNTRFRVVADPAHKDWVTTDFGLEHLINRSICLVVFLLILLPLFAGSILFAIGLVKSTPNYGRIR